MSFLASVPSAPLIRPQFNVGACMDIPTGNYVIGPNGEHILNGGMAHVNSIAGPGNTFKSEILNQLYFAVLGRYRCSTGAMYDTENSMTYSRLARAARTQHQMKTFDFKMQECRDRLKLTQSADILGDDYFEAIKEYHDERVRNSKKLLKKTPFYDERFEQISIMPPFLVGIDSLTEFKVSSVQEKLVDKNNIGESGANTQFMKDGAAKTQLITQLPNIGARAGMYFFMVAHIGMKIEMDQYAPKAPKLAHSRSGTSTKGVPEKFSFINNNLLEIYDAKPLYNSSSDKSAKYPKSETDRANGVVDLSYVTAVLTRNKNGPSGVRIDFVVSQSEGLQPTLTEFHFLKNEDYGFVGNAQNYALHLYPDVKLSRTTVRAKIDEDPLLCRAIELTTHLRQMEVYWRGLDPNVHVHPEVLYKDLAAKGYDWNKLLNTRGYWVFEEDEDKELPYLSAMDLLQMRLGNYHPVWYGDLPKVAKAS